MLVQLQVLFNSPTSKNIAALERVARELTNKPRSVRVSPKDDAPGWLEAEFTVPTQAKSKAADEMFDVLRFAGLKSLDLSIFFPHSEAEIRRAKRKAERRRMQRRADSSARRSSGISTNKKVESSFRESCLSPEEIARNAEVRQQVQTDFPPAVSSGSGSGRLSQALRDALRASDKSMHQIAQDAGVSQIVVSRFLSGERDIRMATADKLAEALGLTLYGAIRPTQLVPLAQYEADLAATRPDWQIDEA